MVSDGEDKGTTPVRGRPFKQGESGNPAGRPVGSKSMTKLLMERLDGRAEELIDALIDRALKGDGAATKIISDRVMPVQRGSFVDFDLPERAPMALWIWSKFKKVFSKPLLLVKSHQLMRLTYP